MVIEPTASMSKPQRSVYVYYDLSVYTTVLYISTNEPQRHRIFVLHLTAVIK